MCLGFGAANMILKNEWHDSTYFTEGFMHIAQKILFIFIYLNENASFNGKIEQKILKYNISFDRIKEK